MNNFKHQNIKITVKDTHDIDCVMVDDQYYYRML